MSTIFSKIVAGEIPCYKVAEDEKHFAFLDISPVCKGHTLVIPKKEVDYLFDLSEEEYADLMKFARKVSKSLKNVMPCSRIGVSVIGMEVPHAHIHLVPINKESDMNFFGKKLSLSDDVMKSISEKINADFEKNNSEK